MGSRTYWVAPAYPLSFADGTPLTTAALTDISPGALLTPKVVGASDQSRPDTGSVLRLRAFGEYSATTGAASIGTLGFYWGGIAGTRLGGLVAAVTTATGAAAWPWWMEWEGEFRQISAASGQIQGAGKLYWPTSLTAWADQPVPATAAERVISSLNTIAAAAVTVGANWSSVTGTPSVTCKHLCVELIG